MLDTVKLGQLETGCVPAGMKDDKHSFYVAGGGRVPAQQMAESMGAMVRPVIGLHQFTGSAVPFHNRLPWFFAEMNVPVL